MGLDADMPRGANDRGEPSITQLKLEVDHLRAELRASRKVVEASARLRECEGEQAERGDRVCRHVYSLTDEAPTQRQTCAQLLDAELEALK